MNVFSCYKNSNTCSREGVIASNSKPNGEAAQDHILVLQEITNDVGQANKVQYSHQSYISS